MDRLVIASESARPYDRFNSCLNTKGAQFELSPFFYPESAFRSVAGGLAFLKHFPGMGQRLVRKVDSPQHPSHFADPLDMLKFLNF